jgi:hypothetical protein
MSPLGPDRLTALPANEVGELVFTRDIPPGASMFECLRAIWIEGQGGAHAAYVAWRYDVYPDGYFVYRAAQDRADAAQDTLAQWASDARGRSVHSACSGRDWSPS